MGDWSIKKIFSGILVFSMVITTTCYGFDDVMPDSLNYEQIKYLEGKDILSDISKDGIFNPDAPISREEFVSLIVKTCYDTLLVTNQIEFEDRDEVSENLMQYIQKALEEELIIGLSTADNVLVKPKQPISREQAAVIISRAIDLMSYEDLRYADKTNISDYALTAISGLRSSNIIGSFAGDLFKPQDEISRAEATLMIYNTMRRQIVNKSETKTYIDSTNKTEKMNLFGIAKDNKNNLIVADSENNIIKRISENDISTVTGKIVGYDEYGLAIGMYLDGKTKEALFNKPTGIAVNSKDEIIVSDTGNNIIRLISQDYVKTLSGQTKPGYKDGRAAEALFNHPTGIAVDSDDNVYVADTLNNCIRKIDVKGIVTTLAGQNGISGYKDGKATEALFNEPMGIAVDKDNIIYVVDTGNQRIRKIENGVVETMAGGGIEYDEENGYIVGDFIDGLGDEARFNFPNGICITDDGTLIIADSFNHSIRAVSQNGDVMTIAGNSDVGYVNANALGSSFNLPKGVLYMSGKIYITDYFNNSIRVVDFDESRLKDFGF